MLDVGLCRGALEPMMPDERRIDLSKILGTIGELKEHVEGRFKRHDDRIERLESWQKASEAFHVEMRKRWDHFDGAQEKAEELQAERHRSNAAKINLIMLLVAILVGIATWATFFRSNNNHSFLNLHSSNPQTLAQFNAHNPIL
jgi:hypothetical protein